MLGRWTVAVCNFSVGFGQIWAGDRRGVRLDSRVSRTEVPGVSGATVVACPRNREDTGGRGLEATLALLSVQDVLGTFRSLCEPGFLISHLEVETAPCSGCQGFVRSGIQSAYLAWALHHEPCLPGDRRRDGLGSLPAGGAPSHTHPRLLSVIPIPAEHDGLPREGSAQLSVQGRQTVQITWRPLEHQGSPISSEDYIPAAGRKHKALLPSGAVTWTNPFWS